MLTLYSHVEAFKYVALLGAVFGISFLIQLGLEAHKRGRRWIVWCLFSFLYPIWPVFAYPIFVVVTRHDILLDKNESLMERVLIVVALVLGIAFLFAFFVTRHNHCLHQAESAVRRELLVCGMSMNLYYSKDFTYAGAVINTTAQSICISQVAAPVDAEGTHAFTKYNIVLVSATKSDFLIQATPEDAQVCGAFSVLPTMQVSDAGKVSLHF